MKLAATTSQPAIIAKHRLTRQKAKVPWADCEFSRRSDVRVSTPAVLLFEEESEFAFERRRPSGRHARYEAPRMDEEEDDFEDEEADDDEDDDWEDDEEEDIEDEEADE